MILRNVFVPSILGLSLISVHQQTDAFTLGHPSTRSSLRAIPDGEIDRAPCFDGTCSSSPLPSDSSSSDSSSAPLGLATRRLGFNTGPTVWSEFGRLSQEYPVANLGQGFPNWLPPKFAIDSLVEAVTDDVHESPHQYTRTAGHPKLVRELAGRYSVHMNREVDAMTEVSVTVGASQALYMSLQTLISPGDEVILFEPFFDLYVNQVKLAGGTPVYVPLTFVPYSDEDPSVITGGEWILEEAHLLDKITPKTRAVILNSPHNPTGKVFTRIEMQYIADAVQTVPHCVVLSDEVYKYIIHAPPKEELQDDIPNANGNDETHGYNSRSSCPGHIHFASLPNMWDRTITISSAGKTFSATGWQVGWCIGPSHLISPIHQLLPYVQFCPSTVIQEALARSLPKADLPYQGHPSYYEYLKVKYTKKRDLLGKALQKAGFAIPDYQLSPNGGFFIFARIGKDIQKVVPPRYLHSQNPAAPGGIARLDWALCQWMAEEKGLLCIPSGPFFSEERAVEGVSDEFIRIAFCKTDELIEEGIEAFMKLRLGDEEVINGNEERETVREGAD